MSSVADSICPSHCYNMSFSPHSLMLLVGEGLLCKIDRQFEGSHPIQMATLKMFPTVPASSPILTPILAQLPLLLCLFFLRFEENKSGGLPSGQPQPPVHLPAIRDHKSLRWMELPPSVVQGFDGVVAGGLTSGQAWSRRRDWIEGNDSPATAP